MKILVSGGNKGIGKAIVDNLSQSNEVHSFARGENTNDRIKHYLIDIKDHKELETLPLGDYDGIVNNVGVAYDGILATQSIENIFEVIQVNLVSTIVLTKLYIRERLARRMPGNIVNISSIIGIRGYSGLAVYSASKAGLDGFTRSLAREMGPKGFRINSVLPGYTKTDMTSNLNHDQLQKIIGRTPLGKLVEPEDIANAVEFLMSEKSRFITGQSIVIDSGITT